MATISHKGNFIVSLLNPKGNTVTDHEQKANLLWTSLRERLGISEYTNMIYDLSSLLTFHDLTTLDDDFREDEIDMVIKKTGLPIMLLGLMSLMVLSSRNVGQLSRMISLDYSRISPPRILT